MRKITQKEYDALPVVGGLRQCPGNTDYSAVTSFGARCGFGEGCSFGAWCGFGEGCSFGAWCGFGEGCRFEGGRAAKTNNPYMAVDRIGSGNRKAYFFDFTDGLHVRAGCFFGDKAAFLAKLDADGDAHKSATYRAALALAELQFGITEVAQ